MLSPSMSASPVGYSGNFPNDDNIYNEMESGKATVESDYNGEDNSNKCTDTYTVRGENLATICQNVESNLSVRNDIRSNRHCLDAIHSDEGGGDNRTETIDGKDDIITNTESSVGYQEKTTLFFIQKDDQKFKSKDSRRPNILQKSASEPTLYDPKPISQNQPRATTRTPCATNAAITRNFNRRRKHTFADVVRCLLKVPIQEDTHPYGIGHLYRTALDGKSPRIQRDESKYLMWVVATVIIVGIAVGVILMSQMYSARTKVSVAYNKTTT